MLNYHLFLKILQKGQIPQHIALFLTNEWTAWLQTNILWWKRGATASDGGGGSEGLQRWRACWEATARGDAWERLPQLAHQRCRGGGVAACGGVGECRGATMDPRLLTSADGNSSDGRQQDGSVARWGWLDNTTTLHNGCGLQRGGDWEQACGGEGEGRRD